MAQDTREIDWDIDKDLLETLDAKQNDANSRFIRFNLFSNSLPINLTGHTVEIYGEKSDYSFIFNNVTIEDATKGKVLVGLTSQALAIPGDLNCELIIYGPSNSILSTKPFAIKIIESLKNDSAVESINEATALTEALSQISEAVGNLGTLNTANANLQTSIGSANTSKSNIDNSTSTANAAKISLDSSVGTANTTKTNLDASNTTANTTKTALDTSIGNGDLVNYAKKNELVTLLWGLLLPSGMIAPFAMGTPPTGWFKCNGQAVSRANYPNLFTAIGTTYGGGDGSTTFNVPDTRGYFLRSVDDGKGIDTGRTLGSTQTDDLKSHTHMQKGGTGPSGTGWTWAGNGTTDTAVTGATGGSETRPKNIAFMYCIKM